MSAASDLEWLMLDLINDERTAAGLIPLKLDLRLNDSSEGHSEWMLDGDVFSHTGSGGSNAGDHMRGAGFDFSGSWAWGENVAWQSERGDPGLADDVANLHHSLMNSPGHRANILDPDFRMIGIGIEAGDYRGWDAVMVTQNFARTAAPLRPDSRNAADLPAPNDTPGPNAAPGVTVSDLTVGPRQWVGIGDLVAYADPDGDPAVRFAIRDLDGGRTVRIDGERLNAKRGIVFDAGDLDTLMLRGTRGESEQTLQIRAHDGEDWGDWDSFVLTTDADWDAVA